MKLEPYWESIFFVMMVSFVVLYTIFLIKDLDNPFDYAVDKDGSNEVSLKPLYDFRSLLKERGM